MPDLDKIYKSKLDHSHGEGLQAVYQAGVDAGKAEVAAQSPPPGSDHDEEEADEEPAEVEEDEDTEAAPHASP